MIGRALCRGLIALLLLLCQGAASADAPKAWAYFGWWLPDSWRSAPLADLDRLLFFELKVDASGAVSERNGWPDNWPDLRQALRQQRTPLDLTLTLFDIAAFGTLFSSDDATRKLLDDAVALAAHEDVAGLQLDFEIYEPLKPQVVDNYRRFVRELAMQLRRMTPARQLSVFFPMGGKAALYDEPTLALLDHVVLQGYDAHWAGSKTAGPVAPLRGDEAVTWEKAVAQARSLGVPGQRLLLSFPLYGYEWPVTAMKPRSPVLGKGDITSFAPLPPGLVPAVTANVQQRVRQHGAAHDPASGSNHYHFRKPDGQLIEGWYEDWWSLDRKAGYLTREHLGGVAFFILGYDDHQLVEFFVGRQRRRDR